MHEPRRAELLEQVQALPCGDVPIPPLRYLRPLPTILRYSSQKVLLRGYYSFSNIIHKYTPPVRCYGFRPLKKSWEFFTSFF